LLFISDVLGAAGRKTKRITCADVTTASSSAAASRPNLACRSPPGSIVTRYRSAGQHHIKPCWSPRRSENIGVSGIRFAKADPATCQPLTSGCTVMIEILFMHHTPPVRSMAGSALGKPDSRTPMFPTTCDHTVYVVLTASHISSLDGGSGPRAINGAMRELDGCYLGAGDSLVLRRHHGE